MNFLPFQRRKGALAIRFRYSTTKTWQVENHSLRWYRWYNGIRIQNQKLKSVCCLVVLSNDKQVHQLSRIQSHIISKVESSPLCYLLIFDDLFAHGDWQINLRFTLVFECVTKRCWVYHLVLSNDHQFTSILWWLVCPWRNISKGTHHSLKYIGEIGESFSEVKDLSKNTYLCRTSKPWY